MLKRMISLVMCMVMFVTMIPVQSFAVEETQEQISLMNPTEEDTVSEELTAPTEEYSLSEEQGNPTEEYSAPEESTDPTEEAVMPLETEPEMTLESTVSTEPAEIAAPESMESVQSAQLSAADQQAYAAKTTNNSISCVFDQETKTLTITGDGPMQDYYLNSSQQYGVYPPWWGYTAQAEKIVIGDGITYIGDYAFYEINYTCENVKEIVIGDSVEAIGKKAFWKCPNLRKLTLGKSLKSVGRENFGWWSSLEEVHISDLAAYCNINYLVETPFTYTDRNSAHLYLNGKKIEDLVIPEGVTEIGDYAFARCNLKSVSFPSTLTRLGNSAFAYNLFTEVTIPAGISELAGTFRGCSRLENIVIPENITVIGNMAFSDCTSLKSVTIPDSVVRISDHAFANCTSLVDVQISDSVKAIGANAFSGCTQLKSMCLPDAVISLSQKIFAGCTSLASVKLPVNLSVIDGSAFSGCEALSELYIPETVATIGNSAFEGCISLASVKLPESLSSLGNSVFKGCLALNELTIPDGITELGNQSFMDCTGLENIVLPAALTSLGNSAFKNCSKLEYLELPGGVTKLGNQSFMGCTGLKSIVLPAGIVSIGEGVFKNCTSLTSVDIPVSLYSIPEETFYGCQSIPKIELHDMISEIQTRAFYGCSGLKEIVFYGDAPTVTGEYPFSGVSAVCYFPADNVTFTAEYCAKNYGGDLTWRRVGEQTGSQWCGTHITWELSENGVLTLTGTGTMYDYPEEDIVYAPWYDSRQSITQIVVSEGITAIGTRAFYNCNKVSQVTLPQTLASIGKEAFKNCSLSSVVWPEALASIGEAAFSATNLTGTLQLPGQLVTVGANAFSGCKNITAAVLPDSMTYIPDSMFASCSYLRNVAFSKKITTIGKLAFSGCYRLGNVELPDGLISIGDYAFSDCGATDWGGYDFTSITLPSTLKDLGKGVFSWCKSLRTVVLPESLEVIRQYTFNYCTNLSELTIPASVRVIESSAFTQCYKLFRITFSGSAPEFGKSALGCAYKKPADYMTAYYPDGDATWTEAVFQNYGNQKVIWTPYESGNGTEGSGGSGGEGTPGGGSTEGGGTESEGGGSGSGDNTGGNTTGGGNTDGTGTGGGGEGQNPGTGGTGSDPCKNGHNFGEWQNKKEPSCKENGEKRRYCSVCGGYEYVIVEALGHQEKIDAAVDATCSETGLTEGSHCSVCNEVLTVQQVIPALGHNWDKGTVTKEPTESEPGILSYSCVKCGMVREESIPQLEGEHKHQYDAQNRCKCGAVGGTCGKNLTWELDETTKVLTISGTGAMVECINNSPWKDYRYDIDVVVIGDGVTTIGAAAFDGFIYMESITIPDSVKQIDEYAFGECIGLRSITFNGNAPVFAECVFNGVTVTAYYSPNDPTWTADVLKDYGGNITWVSIGGAPSSDSCGDNLSWEFDETTKVLTISGTGPMRDFTMDGTWYGAKATDTPWRDIQHKILEVVIENGVTTIGRGAFAGMEQLIVVSLPDTLTSIGDYAFHMNTSLKALNIPNGVTSLGTYSLCCCPNLVSVTLPKGITKISTSLFDQTWPDRITVPASVTAVESRAFSYSSGEIIFTGKAPIFAEDAFYGLTAIVRYPKNDPTWANIVTQNYGGTITWLEMESSGADPDSGSPTYTAASGTWGSNISWNLDANGLLTVSGSGAMVSFTEDPSHLINTGVKYPWLVHSSGITGVVVEEGVTALGPAAFSGLKYVTTVTLPASLTNMSANVFADCVNLKNVSLGTGITEIGDGAFARCTALEEISVPANVRKIGQQAFDGCVKLKNVTMADGLTVIWKQAFRKCTSLTNIYFPESLESIGVSAFESCTGLTKVTLPANLLTLYKHVFYNCSNLKDLHFTGGYLDILPYALLNLTATAFYPSNNPTWTPDRMQNYGGNITWVAYDNSSVPNTGISVDEGNFPDSNFCAWIQTQDYGADAWLTTEELAAVTMINVRNMGIRELTGIHHFTALEILDCGINQIPELDLSENTALKYLSCDNNLLSALNTDDLTALEQLDCSNNQINALDLQHNTALKHLNCNINNLNALDVQQLVHLKMLSCGSNQLTTLDLSKNPALENLGCERNRLTGLDVSKNTALRVLHCSGNQLSVLDVHNQPGLEILNCNSNQLKTLDIRRNHKLETLNCSENQLTALDVSQNTLLIDLSCSFNQLTQLDVSKNIALINLSCVRNRLTALDVSCNTALEYLDCGSNQIESLDVSKNTALRTLAFSGNRLTEINVRNNTALEQLNCSANQLAYLDLSNNPNCKDVNADRNIRQIKLNGKNEFDLSTLPGFDVSKTGNWIGATIDRQTLTAKGRTITYSYQISSNQTVTFTLQANNFDPNAGKMEGQWGDLHWKIDETGKLTVSGIGEMLHYTDPNGDPDNTNPPIDGYPWHRFADLIQSIVVEEGVTTLAEIAFHGLENLQDVKLPGSLTAIGDAAFLCCTGLENIRVPENVAVIGKNVFSGSDSFRKITFTGNAPTFDPETFSAITATAYYPAGNDTWTQKAMQDYGGHIDWRADCAGKHKVVKDAGKTATCTESGLTEGAHCSDCHEILTEQLVIPALGHSYVTERNVTSCAACGAEWYVRLSDEEISLDLVSLTTVQLYSEVYPEELRGSLRWRAEKGSEAVISVDEINGSITAIGAGTGYIIAEATDGVYTFAARCLVEVTQYPKVEDIRISATKLTTELYSTDYASFELLLQLPQNYYSNPVEGLNNVVSVESARFTEDAVADLFELCILDDRRIEVVPTKTAVEKAQTDAKSIANSYSSTVSVKLSGMKESIIGTQKLTLTVKKTLPKLNAKIDAFNSFYTHQSNEITVTGGTVTGIALDNTRTNPDWLKLEDACLVLTDTAPAKNVSGKVNLLVSTEEWSIPAQVTLSVKNTYAQPGLRLSSSTVTVPTGVSDFVVDSLKLTCKNKNDTLESLNVKSITAPLGYQITDFRKEDGSFRLQAEEGFSAGTVYLEVCFSDTERVLSIPLTVKQTAVTLKLEKPSVTLNAALRDSVSVAVNANPAGYVIKDHTIRITEVSGGISDKLEVKYENGALVICAAEDAEGNYKVFFSAGGSKEVSVTVKVINKEPAVSFKASGTLDISFPEQIVTVTPAFKNYTSGSFTDYSYTVSEMKGNAVLDNDAAKYFDVHTDTAGFTVAGKDFANIHAGSTYVLTLKLKLFGDYIVENKVNIAVKQTAVKLKSETSSLSLNRMLDDEADVAVTCAADGYAFSKPVVELWDGKGKVLLASDVELADHEKLNATWQNGKLHVSLGKRAAYGESFQIRLKANDYSPAVTLKVTVPAESKSRVTVSLKASGVLDVIRRSSAITIIPTYKNCTSGKNWDEQLLVYTSADKYKEPVEGLLQVEKDTNGNFVLRNAGKLDPKLKYKVRLVSILGNTRVESSQISISVKQGSAKVTMTANGTTLFALDGNDRAELIFAAQDATQNKVGKVEIKDTKYKDVFEVIESGNGKFAIGFKDGKADSTIRGKTVNLTLNIYLEGNTAPNAKANTTAKLKLMILN